MRTLSMLGTLLVVASLTACGGAANDAAELPSENEAATAVQNLEETGEEAAATAEDMAGEAAATAENVAEEAATTAAEAADEALDEAEQASGGLLAPDMTALEAVTLLQNAGLEAQQPAAVPAESLEGVVPAGCVENVASFAIPSHGAEGRVYHCTSDSDADALEDQVEAGEDRLCRVGTVIVSFDAEVPAPDAEAYCDALQSP